MCPLRLGRSQIHPFREEVSVAKHVIVSETHTHTERERSIFHNREREAYFITVAHLRGSLPAKQSDEPHFWQIKSIPKKYL